MRHKTLGMLCLGLLLVPSVEVTAAIRFVTIGTGGVTGVYYPTGGAISRMINAKRDEYGIRATVESTAGSVYNVNAVMAGDLDFGVVQSDRQFQAYNGTADWEDRPQKNLRAIFAIHPETVVIVAGADTGIRHVADLKGKVVNIGNPGSGQRGNAIDLLTASGLDFATDMRAEGLKAPESASLLQQGKLDAFFYTVGHPNGSVKEAVAGKRKVRFVNIPQKTIFDLAKRYPYYAPATIPVKMYPGVENLEDVKTFGVKATLCTSAEMSDEIVYAITREVFENLDAFKQLHPAYEVLTPESMLQGLSAPLHPGALKYYKEAGLLK